MFVENLTETINLGKKFAQRLNPKSIVLLKGPIGAGKTSFVQGIAQGLSIQENITSPTFALSHHYSSGKILLFHFFCNNDFVYIHYLNSLSNLCYFFPLLNR